MLGKNKGHRRRYIFLFLVHWVGEPFSLIISYSFVPVVGLVKSVMMQSGWPLAFEKQIPHRINETMCPGNKCHLYY
jgi:hypothetical protein